MVFFMPVNRCAKLTWMDAKIGDWVVTPRTGKPVEIQALWITRWRHHGRVARRFKDIENEDRVRGLAEKASATSMNGSGMPGPMSL